MTKNCIISVALMLLAICPSASALRASDDIVKKDVVITTQNKNIYDRDGSHGVEVFLMIISSELEICCIDEGTVSVYLFNSRNQMCGYAEYDSAETPVEWLDVPKQSGTYHIVIITDKSYSEGTFVK